MDRQSMCVILDTSLFIHPPISSSLSHSTTLLLFFLFLLPLIVDSLNDEPAKGVEMKEREEGKEV